MGKETAALRKLELLHLDGRRDQPVDPRQVSDRIRNYILNLDESAMVLPPYVWCALCPVRKAPVVIHAPVDRRDDQAAGVVELAWDMGRILQPETKGLWVVAGLNAIQTNLLMLPRFSETHMLWLDRDGENVIQIGGEAPPEQYLEAANRRVVMERCWEAFVALGELEANVDVSRRQAVRRTNDGLIVARSSLLN